MDGPAFRTKPAPGPAVALEWWVANGSYGNAASGRRFFTAGLFRHTLDVRFAGSDFGFSFFLAVLDPNTGRPHTCITIDGGLVDWTVRRGREICGGSNLDLHLLEVFIAEAAEHGPPGPIRLEPSQPVVGDTPFCVSWQGFELRARGDGFGLCFTEPDGRACRFVLDPLTPGRRAEADGELGLPDNRLRASVYPRLRLTGSAGGELVTGEAWLDHQRSGHDWLATRPCGGRVLGRDWFDINLDDGSDLLVVILHDVQGGIPVARRATAWPAAGQARSCHDVKATATRSWQSPRTHILHPVAWHIEAPGLGADLTFDPLADDQEVALFGPARALWAGAGTVSGTLEGRAVGGRGCGGFHGYGHVFDFQNYLDDFAARTDRLIEEFLPRQVDEARLQYYVGPPDWTHEAEAYTAVLCKPVWDLIARKGKRWRPAFLVLMLEALGVSSQPFQALMCVYPELAHTGSLIIDDIEDRSLIRRGGECIHLRYGLDTALNAGNTLYFLPSVLLADHPHLTERQRLRIHEILNRLYVRAHFGQGLDLYWSRHLTASNLDRWLGDTLGPKILQMYGYKTAAFLESFVEIAVVIAGAGEEMRRACTGFARAFGVAFQILDDVRNFGAAPHWTKVCGEDLAEGKLTYVVWRALALLEPAARERLRALLCSESTRRTGAGVQEGIELVSRSGALRACADEARAMTEREWAPLARRLPPSEAKMMFRLLCLRILELPYDP